MYFWISRCLCRTSTLALSTTPSAYWVFWASEKFTLLISLNVQQTPALKHSPSALLFSAHTHVATTLFKIPPAHCCAVIFRSLAGSLRGFLRLMVTKATRLHTQRDANTSIQCVLQHLVSAVIWNQILQQHHFKQSSALWDDSGALRSQIRTPEVSLSKQQNLLSSNSHVWSALLIPAQLWPSHLFNLNTDQKLLVMGRTVHTIKGNTWSTFSEGSSLLPEVCTLSVLNPAGKAWMSPTSLWLMVLPILNWGSSTLVQDSQSPSAVNHTLSAGGAAQHHQHHTAGSARENNLTSNHRF